MKALKNVGHFDKAYNENNIGIEIHNVHKILINEVHIIFGVIIIN